MMDTKVVVGLRAKFAPKQGRCGQKESEDVVELRTLS